MGQDFLTLRGWAFPGIPGDAQLVFASGHLAMPAAGAGAFLDGRVPTGGTGIVFAPQTLGRTSRMRTQLLAVGVGVRNWQRPAHAGGAIGAGANVAPFGALTIPFGTLPASGVAFVDCVLTATVTCSLDDGAGNIIGYFGGTLGPLRLTRGRFASAWRVTNTTGGGGFYGVHLSIMDRAATELVILDVALREVDQDGAVLAGARTTKLATGLLEVTRPQLLIDSERPELRPVAPSAGASLLDEQGQAFAVFVSNGPGSGVPATAEVEAALAFAVWQPNG